MAERALLVSPQLARLPSLLDDVREGRLRVPRFQRSFVWGDDQRLLLLDSVRRNLPIGSVLVFRSAQRDVASDDHVGPLAIPPANGFGDRGYILDGHQRLATLLGAFHKANVKDPDDPRWTVYFDLEREELRKPPWGDAPPLTWVGLHILFYPRELYEFQRRLFDAYQRDRDHEEHAVGASLLELADRAEALASHFKDYLVPVIPLSVSDRRTLMAVFRRINTPATRLEELDLLAALASGAGFDLRSHFARVAERLTPAGWGRIDPQWLLDVLKLALDLPWDEADPDELLKRLAADPFVWDEVARTVDHAATFLRDRGGVAGPGALPHRLCLILPSEAARVLGGPLEGPVGDGLARWFWQACLADSLSGAPASAVMQEVGRVRSLAKLSAQPGVADGPSPPIAPWGRFDFDSPRGRTFALELLTLGPRDADGAPLPGPDLLATLGADAVPWILDSSGIEDPAFDGPENHWIADPRRLAPMREALRRADLPERDAFLRSHAIPDEAAAALLQGNPRLFLWARRCFLEALERSNYESAPIVRPAGADDAVLAPRGLRPDGVAAVALVGPLAERLQDAIAGAGMRVWSARAIAPDLVARELPPLASNAPGRLRIEAGGGRPPVEVRAETGAGDRLQDLLADALCRMRIDAMDPTGPVRIALWSHAEHDTAHPQAAFAVGALEPAWHGGGPQDVSKWQAEAERRFEDRIAAPLRRLHRLLGERTGERWVLFHPRCHLGIAVRAGAELHHQTGFWVDCEQGGNVWDLNRQPARIELPELALEHDHVNADAPDAVHLLVSISRDVRDAYRAWQNHEDAPAPEHVLHVTHAKGPGQDALPLDQAVDWADAIRARLSPLRSTMDRPVRIFAAAPVVFCVALGRSLHALGRVITMDFSKSRAAYFSSFDFRT